MQLLKVFSDERDARLSVTHFGIEPGEFFGQNIRGIAHNHVGGQLKANCATCEISGNNFALGFCACK